MQAFKLKSFLLLIVLVPLYSTAQKWEIRAGGGGTFMTEPKGVDLRDNYFPIGKSDFKNAITGAGSVSVGHKVWSPDIFVGLRLTVAALKLVTDADVTNGQERKTVGIYMGRPSIFVQPYFSYRYKGFFGGVQAGIITWNGPGPSAHISSRFSGSELRIVTTNFTGFAGGLHTGYQMALLKHFGLFIDMSCNYIDSKIVIQTNGDVQHVKFFQPQVVAGICFLR